VALLGACSEDPEEMIDGLSFPENDFRDSYPSTSVPVEFRISAYGEVSGPPLTIPWVRRSNHVYGDQR
jgi:hypothetical protein